MTDQKIFTVLVFTSLALILFAHYSYTCNEMVCASVVSKCMLTQSCKCDLKNCSCCKECYTCLSYLYSECCSCVEMCPKPNDTRNALSKESHVGDLDGLNQLFNALTEDSEGEEKWTIFTFPVDFDSALYGAKLDKDVKYFMHSTDQDLDSKFKDNILTLNCTVAYLTQCMSWNKCKESCQSMGATSYRWFHDGCCQCVGQTCINYGINESRCYACPENKNDNFDLDDLPNNEDELDYGEGMGPLDSAAIENTNI
uniref:Putative crossveinless n=1 Tax=Corethrella appendiculata TaxID=1370023 RepID=U5EWH2_9DIPT